ncbi:flagellar basal body L-ring protein FlgH [Luteimonas sp. SJ-92]|uniref:Flagellar L-ring protein n=1 Tax=Luteimonas salinisoli TaxID=2752307 RepID=A0A853JEZ3_9GAMM|nr:flagellar basal body L-ring protein FlgH [Luteimonas salinisoli]NZA27913.1 flagellar basal body L-ring protein FlgH [Luteimonas salinisoli]
MNISSSHLRLLAVALCPVLLAGCVAAGDMRPYPPLAQSRAYGQPMAQAGAGQQAAVAAAAPNAGGIYQANAGNTGGMSLFSDRRARGIGDLLTINLVENTTAQTAASTSVGKESDFSLAAPSVFGAPVTIGGRDVLSASVSGGRDFDGTGRSAQSNKLQGQLTVTVVDVLPNGNLVVEGQKDMRLNQGDELVQIQGIVRPADIGPDNTVPSGRVADARIAYGGRGAIAQSNSMGWLSRFFNSRLYPY